MDQKTLTLLLEEILIIKKALVNVVTKDDAKNFATKDDLKSFATKDDLKSFATKDDLKSFATKDDLKSFATKDDLIGMKNELLEKIAAVDSKVDKVDSMQMDIFTVVQNIKADRQEVLSLEKRVGKLERKVFA